MSGAPDDASASIGPDELDAIVQAQPDALLRLDAAGRLSFLNRAAATLCGATPGTLLGRTPTQAALRPALAECLAGGAAEASRRGTTVVDELRLDTDAGPRWFGARFVPIEGGTLAVLVDTSERKRIVSALAERERRLERTLEEVDTLYRNLPIGLCVIDPERRLLRVNARLSAVYDEVSSPRRALAGRRLSEVHPALDALLGPSLDAVFADGESRLGRELVGPLGPGGERRWWIVDLLALRDELGDVRAVSCTVQDITVRKLDEQRLAARAAAAEVLAPARDLDAVVPDLLDAIGAAFDAAVGEWWTVPDGGGAPLLDTRRAFAPVGEPPSGPDPWCGLSEPAGPDGLVAVVSAEGYARRRTIGPMAPGPAGAPARPDSEHTALAFPATLDGATLGVVVLFARARLPNDAQLLEALEQIGRDIGACERRLRDARALDAARAAAELANRSKSDFLANVSHELRSPLTAILGYADLLEPRLDDADDRASVATIRGNGQHLLALLNDILDLAKIESGKFELYRGETALAEAVGEVHRLMAVRAAERGLDFVVEFHGALPERIVTDPLRLRQILINLVANAIKFTDTGSVRLRVRELHPDGGDDGAGRGGRADGRADGAPDGAPDGSAGGWADGPKADPAAGEPTRLAFDVVDTGIGMTRDQVGRLFEPFTQVDASNTRRYGGTGLGLAISRRLAALLGGRFDVRSAPGRGTAFTFELPARVVRGARRVPLAPPAADAADAAGASRVREEPGAVDPAPGALEAIVLVADDRPDIRTLVTRVLERAGARVVAVADGEAVLEALDADHGPTPDAVVMDMQMPRLDGYRATRRLRAAGHGLPVLALTAAAMVGERERCLGAGCDDYLSKPIDGAALVAALSRLLAARRGGRGGSVRGRAAAPGGGARVLLVEDDPDVRSVTARLLERVGHPVRVAASGPEALGLAERWHPDAVLLDLGLPGMSGEEVARLLREAHGDSLAIVALSGRAPGEAGGSTPFDRRLQKPVKLRELTELLAAVRPAGADSSAPSA